jgi:type IV secretion system protein VirB9
LTAPRDDNDADRVVKIAAVDPAQLNFTYKIEGAKLPFRPIRAFDDGGHVYIQIPPGMKTSDASALLIAVGSGT